MGFSNIEVGFIVEEYVTKGFLGKGEWVARGGYKNLLHARFYAELLMSDLPVDEVIEEFHFSILPQPNEGEKIVKGL